MYGSSHTCKNNLKYRYLTEKTIMRCTALAKFYQFLILKNTRQ
jgi:hypothetical protein